MISGEIVAVVVVVFTATVPIVKDECINKHPFPRLLNEKTMFQTKFLVSFYSTVLPKYFMNPCECCGLNSLNVTVVCF